MKKHQEFKETTASAVFKKLKQVELACDFCAPNQGCNKRKKQPYGKPVSWKDNRTVQYK